MIGLTMRRGVLAAFFVSAAMAANVHAQAFTIAGGARLFGGDDGESATMGALRTEFPIGTTALIEFASSISEMPDATLGGVSSVFEAQVQLPITLGDVLTPYFGAGAGMGHVDRASDEVDQGWQGVLSVGAGFRVAVAEQLGVVLDARLRGFDLKMTGSHSDITVGLRYRSTVPTAPASAAPPAAEPAVAALAPSSEGVAKACANLVILS